jgi:hypothetical protein
VARFPVLRVSAEKRRALLFYVANYKLILRDDFQFIFSDLPNARSSLAIEDQSSQLYKILTDKIIVLCLLIPEL